MNTDSQIVFHQNQRECHGL